MIWSALILGFAGSLHCVGMCSPLAMAVTNFSKRQLFSRFLYNSGRILTYGLQGGVIASVGLFAPVIPYQHLVAVALGVLLILAGIGCIPVFKLPFVTTWLGKFNHKLKGLFSRLLKNGNASTTLLLGVLNGFLPCGLTSLALTFCLTLSGPSDGILFMLMFGLGTLPLMFGATGLFLWASKRFNFSPMKAIPVMLVVSGILSISHGVIAYQQGPSNSHPSNSVDIIICR